MTNLLDWSEKDYKLFLGDCLEVMNEIPDDSVDAIIADLPYSSTELQWDSIIPLKPLWKQYKRISKNNSAVILTGKDPFSSILVVSNIKWFRHKWVWEKDKAANFLHAPYMPIANCEDVLVFNQSGYAVSVSNKPTYNPQMSKSETYQAPNTSRSTNEFSLRQIIQRKNPTPLESRDDYNGWLRYPKCRIYFPVDYKDRTHPTQKPVALLEYLIKTYTNPGDIVMDNVMGSGTTIVAALKTKRRAIGIEKDSVYFQSATERIEDTARELRGEWKPLNGNKSQPLTELPMFEHL